MNKNMSYQEFMESMVILARDDLRYTNDASKVITTLTEYGLERDIAVRMVNRLQIEKAQHEVDAGIDNVQRGIIGGVIIIGGSILLSAMTGGLGLLILFPAIFLAPGWVAYGFFQQWSGKSTISRLREEIQSASTKQKNKRS
ncbi:MAG: hypothetical protein AAFR81_29815 [Chloroflexota bacterium]